jgi:activating signal cointegrator 1
MKCLSLWQPWASLIAVGAKTIESRSWGTSYRGDLAIHVARKWTRDLRQLSLQPSFLSRLMHEQTGKFKQSNELPRGCVVAIVELWSCVQCNDENRPGWLEQEFGDYRNGRWQWHLRNVRACAVPVEMSGQQGLFQLEADMAALVRSCAVVQVGSGGGVA